MPSVPAVLSDADLDAYLRRIGLPRPPAPDRAGLADLVRAHARAIPFENLDPFTAREVRLDVPALLAKLVHGGRGGYCFEHNLLLRAALDTLGFATTGLAARVVYGRPPQAPPPARGHMLLRVDLPVGEVPLVVDVGFGGLTLTGVLDLVADLAQPTPHEDYRFVAHDGGEYTQEAFVAGAWRPLYRFGLTPQEAVDYEVTSWYLSHHPESHFVTGLVAARPDEGRRYAVRGRHVAVHHLGGPSEERDLDSPAELADVLERDLRIDLSGLPDVEKDLARLF